MTNPDELAIDVEHSEDGRMWTPVPPLTVSRNAVVPVYAGSVRCEDGREIRFKVVILAKSGVNVASEDVTGVDTEE